MDLQKAKYLGQLMGKQAGSAAESDTIVRTMIRLAHRLRDIKSGSDYAERQLDDFDLTVGEKQEFRSLKRKIGDNTDYADRVFGRA